MVFGYGNQYVRMDYSCELGHGNARANGNEGNGIVDGEVYTKCKEFNTDASQAHWRLKNCSFL